MPMIKIDDIVIGMKRNPKNVRFVDLCKVCEYYFGKPRNRGSSHKIYKTAWQGDPRINIQNNRGKAKAYQVKQVLLALDKLELRHDTNK
jgi:hypothetical protein